MIKNWVRYDILLWKKHIPSALSWKVTADRWPVGRHWPRCFRFRLSAISVLCRWTRGKGGSGRFPEGELKRDRRRSNSEDPRNSFPPLGSRERKRNEMRSLRFHDKSKFCLGSDRNGASITGPTGAKLKYWPVIKRRWNSFHGFRKRKKVAVRKENLFNKDSLFFFKPRSFILVFVCMEIFKRLAPGKIGNQDPLNMDHRFQFSVSGSNSRVSESYLPLRSLDNVVDDIWINCWYGRTMTTNFDDWEGCSIYWFPFLCWLELW